ncbi:MAG TPA: pyridoxamine 5'-phosphate oxidase family protein [Blastocatellia bacterium]|nr:pyridoxamine 5'-phosphate oxidase family protein [Blastocatellia bacterium]
MNIGKPTGAGGSQSSATGMHKGSTINIGKIGETDARAILSEGSLGRLGCIAAGWPYVVPVNYFFDGKYIYIHALPGKKVDALRDNPRACLQVDEIQDSYNWRSVIAYGTFEEISNEETRENVLTRLYSRLPHLTPVESQLVKGSSGTIVFRIKVEDVTGMAEEW